MSNISTARELGTNSASTSEWLLVSGAMNFLDYASVLNQFERDTEKSISVERPKLEALHDFSLDEQTSQELPGSLNTNIAASQSDYRDRRPIWQVIKEIRDQIPPEEWDRIPSDGSKRLDHYLNG